MSRTDKDRPYWVKVQDEGVERHYHHGNHYNRRGRYTNDKVFDGEGNPVMEERIVKLSAKQVIQTVPRLKSVPFTKEVSTPFMSRQGFYTTVWEGVSAKIANPVYSEAERLVALGLPDAQVTIRVDLVQKVEKTYVPAPEGCDYEDRKYNSRDEYWQKNCSKELPYWRAGYSCRCTWCKPGDEPRQRTRKRNFLTQMTKAANSGEDGWEDNFNELDLTQPDMNHRGWC